MGKRILLRVDLSLLRLIWPICLETWRWIYAKLRIFRYYFRIPSIFLILSAY